MELRTFAERVRRRLARRGLPHRRYVAEQRIRFVDVNGVFRYLVPRHPFDNLDAARENLDLAVELLQAADVEAFLVVAPTAEGAKLGIAQADLPRLLEASEEVAGRRPFYLRATRVNGQEQAGLAYTKLRNGLDDAVELQVFFEYLEPRTEQRFGRRYACIIEVWAEDEEGTWHAPSLNTYTSALYPEARRETVHVEVLGRRHPTFETFASPRVTDVRFPVDAVYLWVDGHEPAWQERRELRARSMSQTPAGDALSPVRFEQSDELRYSLRSLVRYAPWIRRIFIVTDQQRPAWLLEDPGTLDLVDHRDILPLDHLPTFNSHAITAAVHRIDDLADRFLLFNDDMLLGRPVDPEDFFFANGATKFFTSRSALPAGPRREGESPLIAARKHSRDIIHQRTGLAPGFGFKHSPYAMDRELLEELERDVPEWKSTMASPFRSGEDIVPEWLHHYLGFHHRRAFPSTLDYAYFDIGSRSSMQRLPSLVSRARRPATYCVNDATESDVGWERRHESLQRTLQQLAPRPSRYEA